MVRRHYELGDRRVFFDANIDFWDISRHFLGRRYQPTFAASFQLIADSLRQAESEGDTFVSERIQMLKNFYDVLDQLTNLLMAMTANELASLVQLAGNALGPGAEDVPGE